MHPQQPRRPHTVCSRHHLKVGCSAQTLVQHHAACMQSYGQVHIVQHSALLLKPCIPLAPKEQEGAELSKGVSECRFAGMVNDMKKAMPGTQIIVQGVLPRGADFASGQYAYPNNFTTAVSYLNAEYQVFHVNECLSSASQHQLHQCLQSTSHAAFSTLPDLVALFSARGWLCRIQTSITYTVALISSLPHQMALPR